MLTYAFEEQSFYEDDEVPSTEDYTRAENGMWVGKFEGSTVVFDANKLNATAQIVFDALREAGCTSVFCRYDGGGDEGFAHFETAFWRDISRNIAETAPLLTSLGFIQPQRRDGDSGVIFFNCYYSADKFSSLTTIQRAQAALDYLAYVFAVRLLGPDYGTGEGSIFGAFSFNLENGEIVDEDVEPPDGMFTPYENLGESYMPTYAMDPGFFEEYNIPVNEEEFTTASNGMLVSKFSGENTKFQSNDLDSQAQAVLAAMKAAGITGIYGTYDGSSDEGFAHFGHAFIGEQVKTLQEVIPLLNALGELGPEKSMSDNAVLFMNC